MSRPVLPGATVGVLGSGQLGRMFALAARRMGYRVATYSPDYDTPTGQVADVEVTAPYEDLAAVADFARRVSVVTFEFENVPAAAAEAASRVAPVHPAGKVLHVAQNRLREKSFLAGAGIPVPRFAPVRTEADLSRAAAEVGAPAVLKTAASGYDGKGQSRVAREADAPGAWAALGRAEAILEELVDFEREVSVVAARSASGEFAHFGVIENEHVRHILDVSVAPAAVAPRTERAAIEIAREVLERLDVVGVLCVEFFVTRDGGLLVNELAPRPHNSGHLTLDACVTSQFEQQLRAVCGLPLGGAEYLRPAAMANILGDLWAAGEPDWAGVCALPDVKLHLYGKSEARPGRKMGHLTVLAASAEEARQRALAARERLRAVGAGPTDSR